MSMLLLLQTWFFGICTVEVRLKMLKFVKFLTYLTVQQGKNRDIKVNKKHVFLWLGGRMCSNAVNSQLKQQYPNFVLEHSEGKIWNERHRETQLRAASEYFNKKCKTSLFWWILVYKPACWAWFSYKTHFLWFWFYERYLYKKRKFSQKCWLWEAFSKA